MFYPKISNNREVGCLLSDSWKNQIISNYDLDIFEDEIHNMNKTWYSNFHKYTEVKSAFILTEETKAIMIKLEVKIQ